jgi:penicillin-binding protein 1A
MAWGRKKSSGRKEPRFGLAAALADLRLTPQDRVAQVEDGRPKRASAKRKSAEHDDDPPSHGRKPRVSRSVSKRRRKSRLGLSLPRLIYWGVVLSIWGAIAVVGAGVWAGAHLPPIQSLEIPKRPPTIEIVGADGTVLAQRGELAGTHVALKDLPPYLPKAFIAIEDRRFYSNFGIDPIGIMRAAVTDLLHGGITQGGSTLTQQLAKNLFLTQKRTLMRKLQEVELALWLEHKFSKDKILDLYLNRVYFGSGAYGVEAAARRYFGKSARNVTLAEAAMLAGLVQSPSRLAPNHNLKGAQARAKVVLAAMVDAKFITRAQERAAIAHPAITIRPAGGDTMNYVADWVEEVLHELIGQVHQSVVVKTTIEPRLQSVAEAAVINELAADSVRFDVSQGALVAMSPDGAVRAMVGGRNYAESQYNRAVTAKRQPGSAFKPFVYLTAIEDGLTPDTIRPDAPLDVNGWKPEDYSRRYLGPVTLTKALAQSLNTVAVRLALEVGPKNVARTAHRLGITSRLNANATIALGTSDVSLLELVGAYAPFANGGFFASPYVVTKIRTLDGKILYARRGARPVHVIQPRNVAMKNTMMEQTLISGTARRAGIPGWQAAGKTGTSQDFRDAWFIGYTAKLVTGVWFGNDDGSPTRKATGGRLPVDVWNRVMRAAHRGVLAVPLPGAQPSSFNLAQIASQISGPTPSSTVPAERGRPEPEPVRASARPEAAAGLDGWLVQRLFRR